MLFMQPYMHRLSKEIGKVMMRRVANKQRKQNPKSRIENKTLFSLHLIVMSKILYYSL